MNLRRIYRSTRTGLFVSKTDAHTNQDTTTTETLKPQVPIDALEALTRCIARHGYADTIRRLKD